MAETAVQVPQNFEERMKARIKDSIGDLITDEELTKMLNRGIEEVFFTEKTVKQHNHWNSPEVKVPGLIHSIVKECLTDKIKEIANAYLSSRSDEVNAIVQKTIDEGVLKSFHRAFEMQLNDKFINFGSQVQEMIRTMPR